jgi:ATP-dependent DNA ligase
MLRSVIPRKSSCIEYVDFVDRQPGRLLQLIKNNDLEGVVAKRKDGRYDSRAKWYKVLNEIYSQKLGRRELFETN